MAVATFGASTTRPAAATRASSSSYADGAIELKLVNEPLSTNGSREERF